MMNRPRTSVEPRRPYSGFRFMGIRQSMSEVNIRRESYPYMAGAGDNRHSSLPDRIYTVGEHAYAMMMDDQLEEIREEPDTSHSCSKMIFAKVKQMFRKIFYRAD